MNMEFAECFTAGRSHTDLRTGPAGWHVAYLCFNGLFLVVVLLIVFQVFVLLQDCLIPRSGLLDQFWHAVDTGQVIVECSNTNQYKQGDC